MIQLWIVYSGIKKQHAHERFKIVFENYTFKFNYTMNIECCCVAKMLSVE